MPRYEESTRRATRADPHGAWLPRASVEMTPAELFPPCSTVLSCAVLPRSEPRPEVGSSRAFASAPAGDDATAAAANRDCPHPANIPAESDSPPTACAEAGRLHG